ncbi:MAG: cobalamin-independent methionine synthase II family protein [Alphaproteobacteria bacterium]|nr:cobalamin-independent methionine synthase II family protein [Alphaproteobacteria bacterium]
MKTSTDRILTTHVGSLPRPPDLLARIEAREQGKPVDEAAFAAQLSAAVRDVVARQVAAGIDSVCDGEQSKISYTFYVRHRLSGIGSTAGTDHAAPPQTAAHRDILDHPDFMERLRAQRGGTSWFAAAAVPYCTGPVTYENRAPLRTDLANLSAAVAAEKPAEAFMNAASPGVLTKFVPDRYYKNEDAYVEALADALQEEYEAINQAGFILQIDAPDLGSARHNQYQHLSDADFLKVAERNIEAVNHATRNIPPDRMRLHICWGNYEGPHTHDIPLAAVFDVAVKARPRALLFEAANPRHAHEWEELRDKKIPDDLILMPGCIDSTTNFVEHPKLVAQRIENYARLVGRERVVAGTDCGFATFAAQQSMVVPSIAWAKLGALAAGARIASERLWAPRGAR